jgi:hypothetical protein
VPSLSDEGLAGLTKYIAMVGMLRRDVSHDIAHALVTDLTSPLQAHIEQRVVEEREACAALADEGAYYGTKDGAEDMAKTLAWLIRSRTPSPAPACSRPLSGVDMIAAERARQVSEEGWTPEHDDQHEGGEIARAAACYAYVASCTDLVREVDALSKDGASDIVMIRRSWSWDWKFWKPKDRIRDLVRAGALCAAEIDRLLRTKQSSPAPVKTEGEMDSTAHSTAVSPIGCADEGE